MQDPNTELVVTHGEPHPGNLITTSSDVVVVDWDTVALSHPERDLWMIAGANEDVVTRYRDLTRAPQSTGMPSRHTDFSGLSATSQRSPPNSAGNTSETPPPIGYSLACRTS